MIGFYIRLMCFPVTKMDIPLARSCINVIPFNVIKRKAAS